MNYKAVVCLLFTPGTKPQHFNTAQQQNANGVIIDLEDSVSLEDKDAARANVIDYFKNSKKENHFIRILRINSLKSYFGIKDLTVLIEEKVNVDAIMLPKTESSQEINLLDNILQENSFETQIVGLIESAAGVNNLERIVIESSDRLVALAFGGADYALDVGATLTHEVTQFAREKIIQSAALKQLATFDQPSFDFNDMNKFNIDIEDAKKMGFSGKLAIHPKQIAAILDSYIPSNEAMQDAEQIVTIYQEAKGKASQYKGKMIDVPVYKNAQRIIDLYKNLKNHRKG